MRPTAADALDGAERLLRSLVEEGSLAALDAEPVLALLVQARVSPARLTFLCDDTRRQLALLDALRPSLPDDLAAEISSRVALTPASPLLDVDEAGRLNAALRDLLARAVRALPPGAERERVRVHLLERVEREPV